MGKGCGAENGIGGLPRFDSEGDGWCISSGEIPVSGFSVDGTILGIWISEL